MAKHLTGYIVPLVILAVSVPMILGKVPPNGVYGSEGREHRASAARA